MYRIPCLESLVEELAKLPSVGRRSALRMAYHLMRAPAGQVEALEIALRGMRERLRTCELCFNLTEESPCPICLDPRREAGVLCVVEEPRDLFAFESASGHRGRYHVLEGTLNPLRGITPDRLRIAELMGRLLRSHGAEGGPPIVEVILATNPNVDGEATAHYLADEIGALGLEIRITRLGLGLPIGSDLEFADQLTLMKAMEGRRPL